MRWLGYALAALVGLALLAAAAFLIHGRERSWALLAGPPDLGPFDLSDPRRTDRPNDALLCTPGLCEGARVDAPLPAFAGPPEALIEALEAAIAPQPDRKRRVDDRADPRALRYVTWTETMRFPDTTQFLAVDLGDGRAGLVAYGRAQLGHSDLGVNRARIERWTAGLAGLEQR